MKFFAPFLFFIFFSWPAFAYDKLFQKHCKTFGVPSEIAIAIARQESALNPLCVNVEGEDFWPKTRAEAEALIRDAQKKDLSYDVGLMQINSQWIRQWKLDPVDLLEPDTNIRYGLRILKQEIERHGMNWRAIARYHSPDPERGRRYALMVYKHMKGRAQLRAMLANPRLRGRYLMLNKGKFKNLRYRSAVESRLLPGPGKRSKLTGRP